MATCPRFRVEARYLELHGATDVHDFGIPKATVYVLESWSIGASTEAVVAGLRVRYPGARIIVLAGKISDNAVFSLLQLGVKGLVAQTAPFRNLRRAIVTVGDGGIWAPRGLISAFLDRVIGNGGAEGRSPAVMASRLSVRERQVLDGVLRSCSNKEIGNDLHISQSTVKFHMNRLFRKFGVRRRSDLILQSIQQPATLVH